MFLYSFVSVSPILKLPLQHLADNLLVAILYTQTLLEGVIILLPLFAVIAAVTLAFCAVNSLNIVEVSELLVSSVSVLPV